MLIGEIWSGGQTGVDRAALDVATARGLATGGWIPRGRRAEDGRVPAEYTGLRETPSDDYGERTTWNVRDTDATLIVHRGSLQGGSAFTRNEAARLGKPVMTVDLARSSVESGARAAAAWMAGLSGTRLNVAGPRASTHPGIYRDARALLDAVLDLMTARGGTSPTT